MGSLYKGLSAGLLRQATYTTARLGIYNNIFETAKQWNDNKVCPPVPARALRLRRLGHWSAGCPAVAVQHARHALLQRSHRIGGRPHMPSHPPLPSPSLQPLPLWQKAVCGLTAGGLGALVGSPADLSLIRMQADTTLPPEQRRNYKGAFDALTRIVKVRGGLLALGVPCIASARMCCPSRVPCQLSPPAACQVCCNFALRRRCVRRPACCRASIPALLEQHPHALLPTLTHTPRCLQDEGIKGLFTGAGPTVVRAMALNMGMLASNDQVRALVEWRARWARA